MATNIRLNVRLGGPYARLDAVPSLARPTGYEPFALVEAAGLTVDAFGQAGVDELRALAKALDDASDMLEAAMTEAEAVPA